MDCGFKFEIGGILDSYFRLTGPYNYLSLFIILDLKMPVLVLINGQIQGRTKAFRNEANSSSPVRWISCF